MKPQVTKSEVAGIVKLIEGIEPAKARQLSDRLDALNKSLAPRRVSPYADPRREH